jgi:maltose/moltooligosaccharide transporter
MFFTPSTLMYSFILIGFAWKYFIHAVCYAFSAVNQKKMGMMMGLFNMFIVIPQIIAALGGINFFSLIDAHINAMILAGISLIAAFCNLLITDKMPFQDKITKMTNKKAFIFDLDGVIVDTAKYHFLKK